jgi:hypothetical protein
LFNTQIKTNFTKCSCSDGEAYGYGSYNEEEERFSGGYGTMTNRGEGGYGGYGSSYSTARSSGNQKNFYKLKYIHNISTLKPVKNKKSVFLH